MRRRMLAQHRENSTDPAIIYTGVSDKHQSTVVNHIHITNTSGSVALCTIYYDDNGTTFDESTALYYKMSLAADETIEIETLIYIDYNGNLAYETNAPNALTVTLFGEKP